MLEGSTGVQVAATHERFLFYTCPRVQPHEPLQNSIPVLGPRWIWTPFPFELAELAGMTELLIDPGRAAHAGRLVGQICLPFIGPTLIWLQTYGPNSEI